MYVLMLWFSYCRFPSTGWSHQTKNYTFLPFLQDGRCHEPVSILRQIFSGVILLSTARMVSTSESTTDISAIYGPFQPCQRFDATPRHRNDISYRELFGAVLSDLRSPGSVGRPAGDVFARACVGDRRRH